MNSADTRRIRRMFDLPAEDGRLVGKIDEDGAQFRDTYCDKYADEPAAVFVAYTRHGDEGPERVEAAYSYGIAHDELPFLFLSDLVSESDDIEITVNAWYLRYVLKDAA